MRKILNIALIIAIMGYFYYLYKAIGWEPSDLQEVAQLKLGSGIVGLILLVLLFIRSRTIKKSKSKNKTN